MPGPLRSFLGGWPELFWSSAACLGKFSAAGVTVWSLRPPERQPCCVFGLRQLLDSRWPLSCLTTSDGLCCRVLSCSGTPAPSLSLEVRVRSWFAEGPGGNKQASPGGSCHGFLWSLVVICSQTSCLCLWSRTSDREAGRLSVPCRTQPSG